MKNLPTELLHNIFILLPIIQKQECMLVCRRWASLIRSRSLFHTITIRDDDETNRWLLKKFIKLIHEKPEIGNQVEEITFENQMDDYTKMVLLSQLPNVNKIVSTWSGRLEDADAFTPDFSDVFDRKCRIRYLDENEHRGLIGFLIKNRLSSQLVTLKAPMDLVEGVSSLLQHMSALKHLTIKNSSVTITGLEELHNTLSSLEMLELWNINLSLKVIPESIIPAMELTRLSVYGEMLNTPAYEYFHWSNYVSKKYINLKHYYFWMDDDLDVVFGSRNTAQLDYTDLLQSIGSQIESWAVDYVSIPNTDKPEALDSFNCQIKNMTINLDEELTILDDLAKTGQRQYIENLLLYRIDPEQDFHALGRMENLKSLSLYFTSYHPTAIVAGDQGRVQEFMRNQVVNLSIVFKQLPESVESVSVKLTDVNFNEYGGDEFNIKKLALSGVRPQGRIDRFISNNLPYLHSLTLKDCLEESQVLYLRNHHFSYLHLDQEHIKALLITLDVNSPRIYCTVQEYRNNYSDLDGLNLPMALEELDRAWFVTLICGSVKRLVLGKYEAYLVADE
jgi:hypothetical protein